VAHSEQNLAAGRFAAPQLGQVAANGVAHSMQNFAPTRFSVPQFEQITPVSSPVPVAARALSVAKPTRGQRCPAPRTPGTPGIHLTKDAGDAGGSDVVWRGLVPIGV
jgi:hypothetical protein